MSQADGSIIIDTQLDTQGFEANSAGLGKAIGSLESQISKLGPTFSQAMNGGAGGVQKFKGRADELHGTISRLESELKALGNTRIPTDDYRFIQEQINKTDAELEKLLERQAKMDATGVRHSSSAWRNLQYDIDLAKQKLETYRQDAADLENTGQAYKMGSDTSQYQQMVDRLNQAKASLKEMDGGAIRVHSTFSRVVGVLKRGNGVARSIGSAMFRVGRTISGAIHKGASALVSKFKNMKSEVDGTRKKLLKMGIMLLGIRGIATGIRQIVNSALNNNEQLKNQLTALKGVIGTALSPAISFLVGLLSKVVTLADQVYQIFTGTSLIAKYNATQTSATADGMADTAKNAKKAKRQLAGFDSLNILSKNDNSNSKSSGGGSGGSEPTPFKASKIKLSKAFRDYIKAIKAAIKKGDFKKVGELIAEGINKALGKINWSKIQKTCKKIATKIADFINGFVKKLDWSLLGKTISGAINTITVFVRTLAVKVNWTRIGKSIATSFNSMLNSINWKLLGSTLASLINIPIHFAENFAYTFNWSKFGKSLATTLRAFIKTIDLNGAANTLSTGLKGIAKAAQKLFTSPAWTQLGTKLRKALVAFFSNAPFGSVVSTVKNALSGLMDAAIALFKGGNVGEKFGKDVGKAIHDWFCDGKWWKKVGNLLSEVALTVTKFATKIIEEVNLEDIENAIATLLSNIKWGHIALKLGELIAKAIVKALASAIPIIMQMIPGGSYLSKYFQNWWKQNEKKIVSGMTLDDDAWEQMFKGKKKTSISISAKIDTKSFKTVNKILSKTGVSYQTLEKSIKKSGSSVEKFRQKLTKNKTSFKQMDKAIKDSGYTWKQITDIIKNGTKAQKKQLFDGLASGKKFIVDGVKKSKKLIEDGGKQASKKAKDAGKSTSKSANDGLKTQNFKKTGTKAGNDYKGGINSTKKGNKTAATSLSSLVNKAFGSSPFKITGTTAGTKFKSGINSTKSGNRSTATSLSSAVNKAFGSSPFKATGTTAGTKFKSGINGTKSGAKTTATSISAAVNSAFGSKDFKGTGTSAGTKFNKGVNSTKDKAKLQSIPVGSNVIAGLIQGIKNAWNGFTKFWNKTVGLVVKIASTVFDIGSPSKVFKKIGGFLMQGLQIGIKNNTDAAVTQTAKAAQAVTEEIQKGDYSITPEVNKVSDVQLQIDRFTDVIGNGVDALMSKLNYIAQHVTFRVPNIALGTVLPYSVKGTPNGGKYKYGVGATPYNDEELMSVIMQAFSNQTAALIRKMDEQKRIPVYIDPKQMTNAVTTEINRRTRVTGKPQILI